MYKIFICLLFALAIIHSSYAQNKGSLKGTVLDSLNRSPLEFATVAAVHASDTSLISYTLTDQSGNFRLTGIPADRALKLIVSYVGFQTSRKTFTLGTGETKDFGQLFLSGRSLDEVVIKGERSPVVIKKDTTEFNTEAFKTRPNAVVEELLRKLPGVQVNNDGSIKVNGKDISKLLIDGKEFFGTDPKVATRNLDADMIDKIQVYDDRENDPDHKKSATEVNKIINLKLKSKVKKSTLGKIQGGMGSRDRYETGGIISNFRDTLQVSLIGLSNNLNKTGFSSNELYSMGGFDRSGGNQAWDGTFGGNNWSGGIERVSSGGLNVNNNYGEKLKLNLSYFFTGTVTDNTNNSFEEQTLEDTKLSSASNYITENRSRKHALTASMEWVPDTLNRIRYEPRFNANPQLRTYSGSGTRFNTQTPLLSESVYNTRTMEHSLNFSHNLNFYHRFKKQGASLTITHSLNLSKGGSEDYSFNDLRSYTPEIPSELRDRFTDNGSRDNSVDLRANVNYPISKKLAFELSGYTSLSTTSRALMTYDKDSVSGGYDLFLPGQSTDLSRHSLVNSIEPLLRFQFSDKFTLRLGLNTELQKIENRFVAGVADINKQYLNFFPTLRIDWNSFNLTYSERIDQPSIDQMQPIVREYSALYKSIGNPNLRPSRNRNLQGSFYRYNYNKQFSSNGYVGLSFLDNNVIQKTTVDVNGATTSTSVNRNGGINSYLGFGLGKQFKKSQNWQIGLSLNLNGGLNRQTIFLNADEGIQNNLYYSAKQGVNFNYNELLSINTDYTLNVNSTSYDEIDYKTIHTLKHTLAAEISLKWPKRFIFDTRYGFNFNSQVGPGFPRSAHLLNLAVTMLMQKKDRGQLKLSGYDLLNQNFSVNRYAWNNSVNTSEQLILKRYFLLTYQYKISIFKGK